MSAFLRNNMVLRLVLACILTIGFAATFEAIVMIGFAFLAPLWEEQLRYTSIASPIVAWLMSALFLSPLLLGGFAFGIIPLGEVSVRARRPYPPFDFDALCSYFPPLAALCVLALFLAIYAYRRENRFSRHGALAWAMFVFVWGVPGLAGYLLHRRWPTSETCHHCGKESPRDRDGCLHCAAAFPPPAMKRIEIFA
jgi:hypothetical protein